MVNKGILGCKNLRQRINREEFWGMGIPLNLVEEKVLQLIDAGVYQIDEMSNILGLHRKLLDITIADLYVKEFITTT